MLGDQSGRRKCSQALFDFWLKLITLFPKPGTYSGTTCVYSNNTSQYVLCVTCLATCVSVPAHFCFTRTHKRKKKSTRHVYPVDVISSWMLPVWSFAFSNGFSQRSHFQTPKQTYRTPQCPLQSSFLLGSSNRPFIHSIESPFNNRSLSIKFSRQIKILLGQDRSPQNHHRKALAIESLPGEY